MPDATMLAAIAEIPLPMDAIEAAYRRVIGKWP